MGRSCYGGKGKVMYNYHKLIHFYFTPRLSSEPSTAASGYGLI